MANHKLQERKAVKAQEPMQLQPAKGCRSRDLTSIQKRVRVLPSRPFDVLHSQEDSTEEASLVRMIQ